MTTPILVLIYAAAAVALFGLFAAVPVWMTRRHPDTAPDTKLPEYMVADWENRPVQDLTGAGQASGR